MFDARELTAEEVSGHCRKYGMLSIRCLHVFPDHCSSIPVLVAPPVSPSHQCRIPLFFCRLSPTSHQRVSMNPTTFAGPICAERHRRTRHPMTTRLFRRSYIHTYHLEVDILTMRLPLQPLHLSCDWEPTPPSFSLSIEMHIIYVFLPFHIPTYFIIRCGYKSSCKISRFWVLRSPWISSPDSQNVDPARYCVVSATWAKCSSDLLCWYSPTTARARVHIPAEWIDESMDGHMTSRLETAIVCGGQASCHNQFSGLQNGRDPACQPMTAYESDRLYEP
ncbi:hypothetical protein A0H81_13235 [Grifola frondosa]|uniref:Uncharacterized protein n=1 Tax=Grifola frondosa TaxID=5627 RepID=A0A1C7LQK9_GRIFR|nr:hypothetical protein A0H81_13235 [Grifola frondosa]